MFMSPIILFRGSGLQFLVVNVSVIQLALGGTMRVRCVAQLSGRTNMSRRTSIGSWAYTIGPYAKTPIDFKPVCTRLKELGFDGLDLGVFPPHPNPGNPSGPDENWPGAMPSKSERAE